MDQISRNFDLIDAHKFDEVMLSQEEILAYFFEPCNAIWFHDGDLSKPHAELTTGLCSNGYIDCGKVLSHPKLNRILAHQLVLNLEEAGATDADWVVGSDHAAATFSYQVALELSERYDRDVRHDFVERDRTDATGKRMQWKRLEIPRGATVLRVEDLISTRFTLEEVRRAVEEGNPYPVNFHAIKGAIVLRPTRLSQEYDDIGALLKVEIQTSKPEVCPLCKAGSKRLRPKTHWKELMGM